MPLATEAEEQFTHPFRKRIKEGMKEELTSGNIITLMEAIVSVKEHKHCSTSVSVDARQYKRRLGRNKALFDVLFPVVNKSMCFGWKDNWTQQRIINRETEEEIYNLFNQLPMDTKITRRSLNKKDVITKSIYIPPRNLKRAIKKAERGGIKENQHLIRLKIIKLYSVDGVFTSEYRLDGCRLFEVTQGLQGLKRCYRRMLLSGTGYCDLDAVNSLPNDLLVLIKTMVKTATHKAMFKQVEYYVNNKKKVMSDNGITKQQYLALILGQRQKKNTYLADIQNIIIYFTNKHISSVQLPMDTKTIWNKYLASILFQMEKEKIGMMSEIYKTLGYETLVYCFDGIILSATPSKEDIEAANKIYTSMMGDDITMIIKETF